MKSVLFYKKPVFWIALIAIAVCILLAVYIFAAPKPSMDVPQGSTQTSLRQQYPQYFDLDTSNGLDLYVWQMAENQYSFGLLPHTETAYDLLFPQLAKLPGANADAMRQILETYGMDEDQIRIIPWQNPLSSYICDYWIITEGEDLQEEQARYLQKVRNMLFGPEILQPSDTMPVYDALTFDVDGDGKEEYCVLGYGRTSGLFTFTFQASEAGAAQPEYDSLFCTPWYDLSFVRCDDGVVRVQGIDQQEPPQTHLFDITVVDGNIRLTEDGQDIGFPIYSIPAETKPQP